MKDIVKISGRKEANGGSASELYCNRLGSAAAPDLESPGRLKGYMALSPLLVFMCIYLVIAWVVDDFYSVPITVAFLFSVCYAAAITTDLPLEGRIHVFSKGASDSNLLLMVWIFILAGAFAHCAKEVGCIEATVHMALCILPGNMILAGLFLAACFISLSIGTSVGTIVALVPVAVGLAEKAGIPVAFMSAIVVGGAFFGDNLSFISDTTIAATKTVGCRMKDKFNANFRIVFPAALIILGLYIYQGLDLEMVPETAGIEWWKVLPYLVALASAIAGMNVVLILVIGILSTGVVGLCHGTEFLRWMGAMGSGITGMGELVIVTFLAGGLLELIRHNGGIDFIMMGLTRRIGGRRAAEFSIAGLVSLANLCTANNTIAIITTGGIARDITEKIGLDKRRAASILDTFSCLVQGIIPYGAQLLIAAGLAEISPLQIIPFLYYPFCMGMFAILSIIFRYPRKYS